MSEKKLTPVMQQYMDIKAENPDALLLFRLGDFYEVFFEDAKIVSKTIGLVLTSRSNDNIPMCGIPWHAAESYLGRLVRAGFKVALVEQTETPEQARAAGRKFIERKVVRVLTPGTLTDENLLSPNKSNFLVAIAKDDDGRRMNDDVNNTSSIISHPSSFSIAGCDISTGEFFTGESASIADDIARINPAEIIYPENIAELPEIVALRGAYNTTPVYEKIYKREDINQIVSKVFGIEIDGRRAQSEGKSLDFRAQSLDNGKTNQSSKNSDNDQDLKHLNSKLSTLKSSSPCDLRSSTYGDAVALLAGYLFNTQRGANIAFRAPYVWGAGAQLLIDSATWKSLEIDNAINDGGVCLVDILDRTRTAAGARRLRSYLRSLPAAADEIRKRQEHIGHLILNPDVLGGLTHALSRVPDVGRSLSRLLAERGFPRDIRVVSEFMQMLPDFKFIGKRMDSHIARKFENIKTFDRLTVELKSALADELPTFFRDGMVIRAGFDIALDNMRNLARGARETIAGLQAEYAKDTGVPTLKIKYNNILGYFIEVPSTRADVLMRADSGFIHRQTMAGNMRFTTGRLIDLDNEVRAAADRASGMESEIIDSLIGKIREIAGDLQDAVELIADADVWAALADVATDCEWVRPTITDGTEFEIIGGRHPVIESVLRNRGDKFVKNNCHLDKKSIALITGPNMAGKSTYLRQNALIVILTHLGSFVPAASATMGLCDQLFSRVGASDNLAAGQSTFMVEMVETANILKRASEKSFIIFDEIGRGTATYDGMAIATAVLEFLDNLAPRTLFATHYHELTAMVDKSPHSTLHTPHLSNTQCLTIEVAEHNNEIIFMHKIVPGVASRSYGIHVAKMAGMPASVVDRAEYVLENLECRGVGAINEIGRVQTGVIEEAGVKPTKISQPKPDTPLSLFG